MSCATEAELGACYINTKQVTLLQQMLMEMDYPQPLTPIQTDNCIAYGIVTNKTIQKATKAMNMCFHWLHDCKQQQHAGIIGAPENKLH